MGALIVSIGILGTVGAIAAVGYCALLYFAIAQTKLSVKKNLGKLEKEVSSKEELKEKIEGIYGGMVDLGTMRQLVTEFRALEESLKAERGRITITQAELETVETRLRELEEIERELEASGIETNEEMKILEKKQAELRSKNDSLKQKIAASMGELENLLGEIELSTQAQEQMAAIQTELLTTQEKIDVLILQIEQGNEQYFILKRRYDALDIEYAQLYEKFAEVDSGD